MTPSVVPPVIEVQHLVKRFGAFVSVDDLSLSVAQGEVLTGLLYVNPVEIDLHQELGTSQRPLNGLPMAELCPGSKALAGINARLR